MPDPWISVSGICCSNAGAWMILPRRVRGKRKDRVIFIDEGTMFNSGGVVECRVSQFHPLPISLSSPPPVWIALPHIIQKPLAWLLLLSVHRIITPCCPLCVGAFSKPLFRVADFGCSFVRTNNQWNSAKGTRIEIQNSWHVSPLRCL